MSLITVNTSLPGCLLLLHSRADLKVIAPEKKKRERQRLQMTLSACVIAAGGSGRGVHRSQVLTPQGEKLLPYFSRATARL